LSVLRVDSPSWNPSLPMFFGVTKKSAQFDFLVAGDVVSVPGKDYMPSCAEIAKARAK